ncbi:MAG: hypothetical protein ACPIOQ_66020, partial [Promethearchaeia archaeon]
CRKKLPREVRGEHGRCMMSTLYDVDLTHTSDPPEPPLLVYGPNFSVGGLCSRVVRTCGPAHEHSVPGDYSGECPRVFLRRRLPSRRR